MKDQNYVQYFPLTILEEKAIINYITPLTPFLRN